MRYFLIFHVYLQLTEKFQPFTVVSVIAAGDLFQLPPVGGKPEFISSNSVYIILGNSNMNAFNDNRRRRNVPSSCNQIVAVLTHIFGSLLDHVYVHKEFSKELNMQSVIDTYFSDHDAVKFRFV